MAKSLHFSFFAKKISKSLQRKRRNCERRKNENSNSFSAQIKWYYHAFQFPVVNRKTVDQKPLFCIFSSNFTVVLCSNVIKNFQIWNYFIILTNFLQNKCKIRDVSPIFFFAFFASFYLQRIFFAKIFFVCKDSSFAVQYILLPHMIWWCSHEKLGFYGIIFSEWLQYGLRLMFALYNTRALSK